MFSISNWNEGGFVVNGNLDELIGPELDRATLVYLRVSKKGQVQRAVAYLRVSAKGLERVGALVEQRQTLTQTIVSVWGLSRGWKLRPQNR